MKRPSASTHESVSKKFKSDTKCYQIINTNRNLYEMLDQYETASHSRLVYLSKRKSTSRNSPSRISGLRKLIFDFLTYLSFKSPSNQVSVLLTALETCDNVLTYNDKEIAFGIAAAAFYVAVANLLSSEDQFPLQYVLTVASIYTSSSCMTRSDAWDFQGKILTSKEPVIPSSFSGFPCLVDMAVNYVTEFCNTIESDHSLNENLERDLRCLVDRLIFCSLNSPTMNCSGDSRLVAAMFYAAFIQYNQSDRLKDLLSQAILRLTGFDESDVQGVVQELLSFEKDAIHQVYSASILSVSRYNTCYNSLLNLPHSTHHNPPEFYAEESSEEQEASATDESINVEGLSYLEESDEAEEINRSRPSPPIEADPFSNGISQSLFPGFVTRIDYNLQRSHQEWPLDLTTKDRALDLTTRNRESENSIKDQIVASIKPTHGISVPGGPLPIDLNYLYYRYDKEEIPSNRNSNQQHLPLDLSTSFRYF